MSAFNANPTYNKVAVVTGAAGTLGWAVTDMLIEEGYKVAAIDVMEEGLNKLVDSHAEGMVMPLVVDISNSNQVKDACEKVYEKWGIISILCNNAGILSNKKCVETPTEEWQRVMRINIDGAFFLTQHCLPYMREQGYGRIVNTCSMAAKTGGVTAGTAYSTSKGAMTTLTFSIARETAEQGITCNGISPAYVRTPMVMKQLTEEQRKDVISKIPVGRFCEAIEFAHVVKFLISPLSGFITGEIIDQNGGFHMD